MSTKDTTRLSSGKKMNQKKNTKKEISKKILEKKNSAEKAAAEKVAAEKAAAEKAAAEKAAAEKAAAEKAAAEKVAAEKAAAEKAAAEKAAAEKVAAEKAAAEKAAAEKAAAEKVAAEKAAAEKAAAEKAAAEKAAVIKKEISNDLKSNISISYDSPQITKHIIDENKGEPLKGSFKLLILSLVILISLVFFASVSNNSKYYLVNKNCTLEVWQGTFAPLGKKCLEVLNDIERPNISKKNYSKTEIYPIIFEYYLNKADSMFEINEAIPDFEKIRSMLLKALPYGSFERDNNSAIYKRLNNIDRIIFLCKADILASTESSTNIDKSITMLNRAKDLTKDESHKQLILQKIEIYKAKLELIQNNI